jgi:hypothetical protein
MLNEFLPDNVELALNDVALEGCSRNGVVQSLKIDHKLEGGRGIRHDIPLPGLGNGLPKLTVTSRYPGEASPI